MQGSLTSVLQNLAERRVSDPATLLCVCPNSEAVVKAAISAFDKASAPLLFVATLNQVDTDGGYTGWTPESFQSYVQGQLHSIKSSAPVFICLDHGGPWKKRKHLDQELSHQECISLVKESIRSCIQAGYSILHLDATGSHPVHQKRSDISYLVELTIELQSFAEQLSPDVFFEVGTHEDGLEGRAVPLFNAFMNRYYSAVRLGNLRPASFCVGDIGTTSVPGEANEYRLRQMAKTAADYGGFLKAHFSDDVSNRASFPILGVGAANIGPGLSAVEYQALKNLEKQSRRSGNIGQAVRNALFSNNYWSTLVGDSVRPDSSASEVRVGYAARYVWNTEEVHQARLDIYHEAPVDDAESYVIKQIETYITTYVDAFNLTGSKAAS